MDVREKLFPRDRLRTKTLLEKEVEEFPKWSSSEKINVLCNDN